MRVSLLLAAAVAFAIPTVQAQEARPVRLSGSGNDVAPEAAYAVRARDALPVIDGRLDDRAWQTTTPLTDFRQRNPDEGAPATERTEVRFVYSDRDLYIGIRAFDREPSRIVGRLVRRDQPVSADYVDLFIDSYHDRRTAFGFSVNPSGARGDVFVYDDGQRRDDSWDPVYDWATQVDSLGWTAELRIPFSQLRFPKRDSLAFGLRVRRFINRKNEEDNWPFFPREQAGEVSRYADLSGLKGIPAPRRLEFLPYSGASRSFEPGIAGAYDPSRSTVRTGGDLKVGLTSGLTMDLTITPDFGQVEADPAVVNLTGFESFFPEKRPFFVEGTDIFRFPLSNNPFFGDEGLVYTRRIGREPQLTAISPTGFLDSPLETTILGAAKISGQIGRGWSLGIAQALTSKEQARLLNPAGGEIGRVGIEPFTSYTVVRARRVTHQGRVVYGVVATGVGRRLDDAAFDVMHRTGFAGGGDYRARFGHDTYEFQGAVMGSRVDGSRNAILQTQLNLTHNFQRPDQTYAVLDSTRTSLTGLSAQAKLGKVAGPLIWEARFATRSPGFEANDIGFMRRADAHEGQVQATYRWLKPGTFFRRFDWTWSLDGSTTYGGELGTTTLQTVVTAQFLNYWRASTQIAWEPAHIDIRALRGGPSLIVPAHWHINPNFSSDSTKELLGTFTVQSTIEDESGKKELTLNPGLRWRPPGPVALSIGARTQWSLEDRQYLTTRTVAASPYYVFGRMNRREVSLTLRTDVSVTPRLTFQFYAQPFVSARRFENIKFVSSPHADRYADRFDVLGADRLTRGQGLARVDVNRDGVFDFSFDDPDHRVVSLRTNAVLRWEFRPGSTLYLVWQQNRNDEANLGTLDALHDLGNTFSATGRNVLAVKIAYWIGL
ncbi:MAG: carbohydrate binding family 9 domain-containing protein [Gemmatimonadetes bacterium]|nr:carbohydrate binding family 9 domain-containing protein [Gemmatimonadota bacterium]